MKIEEVPSIEIRDWLMNDILVHLWESRPLFEKVAEEGVSNEDSKERVVIDLTTGLPLIETLNRGVTKINLISWLKKSPPNP